MKTDTAKKVTIRIGRQKSHETLKKVRKTPSVYQNTATDKENLVGRSGPEKISKLSEIIKTKTFLEKGVQTDADVTAADLTSEDPGVDYWRKLADKRGEDLENSFREKEELKANIEALQEENKICKAMLEESTTLVEILKEELLEKNPDEADDNTEDEEND